MCRLLAVCSQQPFDIRRYIEPFAEVARTSTEYQGHGWGCGWMTSEGWELYHDINPVWEDASKPSARTRVLVAHARSAFRDEGIEVGNNMPFTDGRSLFLFNGELRGVRIKEEGRIGAEKVFNFIRRFDKGDMKEAMERGLRIVESRTRYTRAMNIIIADAEAIRVTNRFSDSPDYFQMYVSLNSEQKVICSEPIPQNLLQISDNLKWKPVKVDTVHTFLT